MSPKNKFKGSHSVPPFFLDGDFVRGNVIEEARAEIEQESDPARKLLLMDGLAGLYATILAELPKALDTYNQAYTLAQKVDSEFALDLLAKIGVVHLRIGELANCEKNHNQDSCIFPLSAKAVHTDISGAQAAVEKFTEYLKHRPGDTHVAWLLYVAKMALGRVGERAGIVDFAGSSIAFPRFFDQAAGAGLHKRALGAGGVLAEDFNGDGNIDIVISSTLWGDPLQYFENSGNGHFIDRSQESGIAKTERGLNLNATDYNNDGRVDIYVNRRVGRGLKRNYEERNVLLRNNEDGTFTDVTKEVGLHGKPNKNLAALWADFDNDGWLDLFVCNENRGPDLFHNKNGKFTQKIDGSGIEIKGICGGAAYGDVNNDGKMDIYVTHLNAENRLFLNKGGMKFERSQQPLIEKNPKRAYTTWFFDYDNDGWLDLFVANLDLEITSMLLSFQGKPHPGDHQRLFRNTGQGKFEDVTKQVGLDRTILVMGANYGDLNNDGYPDIILGTGAHSLSDLVPNIAYLNQGGSHFSDISVSGGFSNLQKGHGVAVTDFNKDGQPDVLISLGGAYDSDRYFPQLLANPGFPNHWITLQLSGTSANRLGIGARVRATIRENGKKRVVHGTCSKGSSFGSNTLQVHLGLGKAVKIEQLEVTWPGDTTAQVFSGVDVNATYRLVQGAKKLEKLSSSPWKFKKSKTSHSHH